MSIRVVEVDEALRLEHYASHLELVQAVETLRSEAKVAAPLFAGRSLWMVNSTEMGGGVAEMLPKSVSMLRELGVDCHWAVMGSENPAFFTFTKRLHNMIHGVDVPAPTATEGELYLETSRENAEELARRVGPEDVIVTHDPQALAVGALLKQRVRTPIVWRCHIGSNLRNRQTREAWGFLRRWAQSYDGAVFSAPEYIPDFLAGMSTVIYPGLDPLSHKNRPLNPHKLMGVLCNARLALDHAPVLTPPFAHSATRLQANGEWSPACDPEEIGLPYRPIIAQVSRWDRLKGFGPLMAAFAELKRGRGVRENKGRHRRRLQILRLVLAGPDPGGVADDPEASEVLAELASRFRELDGEVQKDIALVRLPMSSRKENALMVNAIQRCATIAVQNSLAEGFGLTVAEAMWKGVPVVASSTPGPLQQIRDEIEGRLVRDPEDTSALAELLDGLLRAPYVREELGRNAARRVKEDFLIFNQLGRWLRFLAELLGRASE